MHVAPPSTLSLRNADRLSKLTLPEYTIGFSREPLAKIRILGKVSTLTAKRDSNSVSECLAIPNEVLKDCASASCFQSTGTSVLEVTRTAFNGRSVDLRNESMLASDSSTTAFSCTSFMAASSDIRAARSVVTLETSAARSSASLIRRSESALSLSRASCSSFSRFFRTASTWPTCPILIRAISALAASRANVCFCNSALSPRISRCSISFSLRSSMITRPPSRVSLRNSQMRSKSVGPS
mmetsp:Transcript_19672/g.48291  ORF Transcript_19672/g.48291 Transcript_19672/m.48291 type:complete len:240 (-) Transcript_19672:98-817(-)